MTKFVTFDLAILSATLTFQYRTIFGYLLIAVTLFWACSVEIGKSIYRLSLSFGWVTKWITFVLVILNFSLALFSLRNDEENIFVVGRKALNYGTEYDIILGMNVIPMKSH